MLVALVTKGLGLSLDFTGRVTSYIFLVLCLIPARAITRKLEFPVSVFYVFIALLFSAPVYIYWGRTFMIETTAVFFTFAAVYYFIKYFKDGPSLKDTALYLVFMVLAHLQKTTTPLPVLVVFSLFFLTTGVREAGSFRRFCFSKKSVFGLLYIGVPLVASVIWTRYTDSVKMLNPFGPQLTSTSLSAWNWGTLNQRFSSDLYFGVIWKRLFEENLGGFAGVVVLLSAFLSKNSAYRKAMVFFSIVLGVLPLFIFTNLHIQHQYYQTANLIFLTYALATALGGVLMPRFGNKVALPALLLIVISNYVHLSSGYLPLTEVVFSKSNSRDYAVGSILKRELRPGEQFVAYGNEWSSTFAYISQRKGFTVPPWFKSYSETIAHPERFVERDRIGGLVACATQNPSVMDLLNWSTNGRNWKLGEIYGCFIAVPQRSIKKESLAPVRCQGKIENVQIVDQGGQKILAIRGWSVMSGGKIEAPDEVVITLSKPGSGPVYLEALKVPQPQISTASGDFSDQEFGFSRIAAVTLSEGEYDAGVVQRKGDRLEACPLNKVVLGSSTNN
jgi:hypothetical protein